MIYKKRTSEVYIHSFVSLMQMGASLRGACLRGARFQGADLQNVDLMQANLEGADFQGVVSLQGARVWGAKFKGAKLQGVDLRFLSKKDILTQEQLKVACVNEDTIPPSDLYLILPTTPCPTDLPRPDPCVEPPPEGVGRVVSPPI